MTMTCAELRDAYWRAMEAAHAVDIVAADAKIAIARSQCAATESAEAFNKALAEHLIARRAPNGCHVDLFGDGMIKQREHCHLDPPPISHNSQCPRRGFVSATTEETEQE